MTDVRAVAIRFADLWAVDHHQMVDEIYAPNIEMQSMADPNRLVRGLAELHDLEDELARRVPEHRHELVRVIAAGSSAFLETTVVGAATAEYAQAAVWWEIDEHGQVCAEIGWFDWNHRTTDTRRSHGTVPADDRRSRGPAQWYRELAERLVAHWSLDPGTAVQKWCTAGCTADLIGQASIAGRSEISKAAALVSDTLPTHQIDIVQVLAEGGVIAVLCHLRCDGRITRGTIVLTLDAVNQITGARLYIDWAKAIPETLWEQAPVPADSARKEKS